MDKLLVSFSGGETSAFMAQWLWAHKKDEYEMIFVFANTGQENEETYQFVKRCSEYFEFDVVWVEANVHLGERRATTHGMVDFRSAARDGQPFEAIISKYGIPNQAFPHCTREMKEMPIRSYARSIGWKNYYTAIGIRNDEIDRMNSKRKEKKFIYPLISWHPMTKPMINFYWNQQPFRLNLKGYQGNCITCWKKNDKKLYQIAKENEMNYNFFGKMESRYGRFTPESRLKLMKERDEVPIYPMTFFRRGRTVKDIIDESKQWDGSIIDDSRVDEKGIQLSIDLDGESCEVFSECGS